MSPKIGTAKLCPLRLEHRDGVALGVALHRCAKRHHLGGLFDALLVCVEREFDLWWQQIERHAMYVLVAEEAVQKHFDQFVICKNLHRPYGQFVESRKDCAELELQNFPVRLSSAILIRPAKSAKKRQCCYKVMAYAAKRKSRSRL